MSLTFIGRRRGRPPRAEVRSTERISFALTTSERLSLVQVARENNMKMSEVIRDAVNTFVCDYADKTVFVQRIRE
jgi:hypothetical protein